MKAKLFFLVIILTVLCYSGIAYAGEEITLTTYYPAPYGEYNSLSVGDPTAGYTATNPGELLVQGNVGIGTTGPDVKLDVAGSVHVGVDNGADYLSISPYTTDNIAYLSARESALSGGTTKLAFQVYNSGAANAAMLIDNQGNVGIGTASPTFSSGFFGLEISDSNAEATDAVLRLTETGSGLGNFEIRSTRSASGNMLQIGEGSDTFMTIRSDDDSGGTTSRGNVGIGTASPGAKLEVVGGPIRATGGLIIQTTVPSLPVTGQMWLQE